MGIIETNNLLRQRAIAIGILIVIGLNLFIVIGQFQANMTLYKVIDKLIYMDEQLSIPITLECQHNDGN